MRAGHGVFDGLGQERSCHDALRSVRFSRNHGPALALDFVVRLFGNPFPRFRKHTRKISNHA